MDRTEYKEKLDSILSDTEKFKHITRNPVNDLKIKVNKIIKEINKSQPNQLFQPITGEYKPGYLYGTVKTHKANNPLRPIIFQVTAPTHRIAKAINSSISPTRL